MRCFNLWFFVEKNTQTKKKKKTNGHSNKWSGPNDCYTHHKQCLLSLLGSRDAKWFGCYYFLCVAFWWHHAALAYMDTWLNDNEFKAKKKGWHSNFNYKLFFSIFFVCVNSICFSLIVQRKRRANFHNSAKRFNRSPRVIPDAKAEQIARAFMTLVVCCIPRLCAWDTKC